MKTRKLLCVWLLAASLGATGGLVVAGNVVAQGPAEDRTPAGVSKSHVDGLVADAGDSVRVGPAVRVHTDARNVHGKRAAAPAMWRIELTGISERPVRNWIVSFSGGEAASRRITREIAVHFAGERRRRRGPRPPIGRPSLTDTLGCRLARVTARALPEEARGRRALFEVQASILVDSLTAHSRWISVFDSTGARLASTPLEVKP